MGREYRTRVGQSRGFRPGAALESPPVRTGTLVLLLVAAGCRGGWHERGEQQVLGQVAVGIPSSDGDLLWAGADEPSPDVAGTVAYGTFVRDRVELLGGIGYRHYDHPDEGAIHAVEFQFDIRYFVPLEFHLGKVPIGFFLDAAVGVIQSSKSIPSAGTHTNIIQEAGGGIEAVLGPKHSLLVGYHQRHSSNGGGNVPDNPGYNDHQVFLAFAWRW